MDSPVNGANESDPIEERAFRLRPRTPRYPKSWVEAYRSQVEWQCLSCHPQQWQTQRAPSSRYPGASRICSTCHMCRWHLRFIVSKLDLSTTSGKPTDLQKSFLGPSSRTHNGDQLRPFNIPRTIHILRFPEHHSVHFRSPSWLLVPSLLVTQV